MDVESSWVVKVVLCLIKINYGTGRFDGHEALKHHLENGRLETLMSYQLTKLMNLKAAVCVVKWKQK
jgi:hypothetical protein